MGTISKKNGQFVESETIQKEDVIDVGALFADIRNARSTLKSLLKRLKDIEKNMNVDDNKKWNKELIEAHNYKD
jgi:hypothetical protein